MDREINNPQHIEERGTAKNYVTVQDRDTLKQMYDAIVNAEIIALDTETTSLNMRKGEIIGFSISTQWGEGFYIPNLVWNYDTQELDQQYIGSDSVFDISTKLLKMMQGKKLVCHNSSFDIRYIKNYFKVDLLESLWLDTALLVHTVQEEGAGMGVFGLKPLAISIQDKIGLDVEKAANQEQLELKESIKRNGGQITRENFEIYKADLEILSKYAAADTDLTLRLMTYFLEILKQEGLEKFFFEEEVMPLYKEVTIPMEELGVALDLKLLEETKEQIIKDLEKNKEIVLDSLLKLPEGRNWIVDTALREFTPSNRGNWAQKLVERYSLPLPRSEKTGKYSMGKKLIEELEDSNIKEFLLTGDLDLLDELEVVRISMALWKEKNGGDYINIQSKKHLGEIAFNYLGVKPLTKTLKGQDKFDMDMLKELSKEYEWAENLRVYNKLLKIKSTYIDRFYDNHEDGKYYPYFKQNGTVSGRYGSDLQQLPKPKEVGEDAEIIVRYTNLVRAFFIAGEGRKIIDADYTSLEPHCFASVTGDKNLQDIFNNGWDFYSTVAIKTEKLDEDRSKYPDGVSPDTKSKVFLKKIDPVKRNQAKAYSLGIAYGMEAYALSKTLDIPQKEAEVLVNGYLNGFPQLKEWRINSREQVKNHGYIKNYVGRIRHLPKAKLIYDKFGESILDWKYRNQLAEQYGKEQVMQWYRDYRNAMNNCLNYQLQSLAASVVNRAALMINRMLKAEGIDGRVQAQIHDQLIINVPEEKAEYLAPKIQHIMENNLKLPGVTLKAPPEIANNFEEGH